ncbi:MAG: DUF3795 domain-containing protein [Gammaproteobacteria bacterium]|nr:DUF3795 domain-containing protein [Gammaproteobacteria bacterium]MBU1413988.1 DUF3795 domain-containing protein [Gammaproteobacteria bacterium]
MTELQATPELVARCGLYCGACKSCLNGKCPGCRGNSRATWCTIRTCCSDKGIATCAECAEFADPRACGKFNNFMSKIFGLIFRSDRAACIEQIRQLGLDGHAKLMADRKAHTIRH